MGSSSSKPSEQQQQQQTLDINTFKAKLLKLHPQPQLYAKVPAIIKANTKLSDPEIAYFVFCQIPDLANIESKLKAAEASGPIDPRDAEIRFQIKTSANEQINRELAKNLDKLVTAIDQIKPAFLTGGKKIRKKLKGRK